MAVNDTASPARDVKLVSATHVADINISSHKDNLIYPYVSCIVVVSRTRLLVADHGNGAVKLLDIDKGIRSGCHGPKCIAELKLKDQPFAIAVINGNQAIVSTYSEHKLLSVKIEDTLKVDRDISINGQCRCVAFYQNQLFVTLALHPRIEIMDLEGNVLKIIQKNTDGGKLFIFPELIHISPKNGVIYVSDLMAKNVICLTLDGTVLHQYDRISDHCKVFSDKFGHFYVAGSKSMVMHVVAADFADSKTLLTAEDGLDNHVLSVGYCQNTNRLFVAMDCQNSIRVFQLTYM